MGVLLCKDRLYPWERVAAAGSRGRAAWGAGVHAAPGPIAGSVRCSQEQRAGPAVSGSGLRPRQLLPAEGRQPAPAGRMGKEREPGGCYFLLRFYSGHSDITLLSASHSRGSGFESRSCRLRVALGPLPNPGFYFHLRPI